MKTDRILNEAISRKFWGYRVISSDANTLHEPKMQSKRRKELCLLSILQFPLSLIYNEDVNARKPDADKQYTYRKGDFNAP